MNINNFDDIDYIKNSYIIDFLVEYARSNVIDEIALKNLDVYIYFCTRENTEFCNVHFIEIDFFNDVIQFEWYGDWNNFISWRNRSNYEELTIEGQVIFLEEFLNFVEIITNTKGVSIKREYFIRKYDLK